MRKKIALSNRKIVLAVAVLIAYVAGRGLLSGDIALVFGLLFCLMEVTLLWTLIRHRSFNRVVYWLSGLALVFLGAIVGPVQSSTVLATVHFLESSILLAILAVGLERQLRQFRNPYWLATLQIIQGAKSTHWCIIVVGISMGLALIIVVATPILVLPLFEVPILEIGQIEPPFDQVLVIVAGTITILLILSTGPLAVRWRQPQGWQARLATGAMAGLVAGALLFVGLGSSIAGLITYSPLYTLALSSIDYSYDEWLSNVIIAINITPLSAYIVCWLLVIGLTTVGGLTGLLIPIRPVQADQTLPVRIWPLVILATVSPFLVISIVVNSSFLSLLAPVTQNAQEFYGFRSPWPSIGNAIIGIGQPWLALTVVQIVGLIWLYRVPAEISIRQLAARIALFSGAIGLILPGLLYIFDLTSFHDPWRLAALLLTIALSLEITTAGWRLWKQTPDTNSVEVNLPRASVWVAAGILGSILGVIFSYQLLGIWIILAQAVFLMEGLSSEPDLINAASTLLYSDLFTTTLLSGFMIIGAQAGWALFHWRIGLQINPQKVTDQPEESLVALPRSNISLSWWLVLPFVAALPLVAIIVVSPPAVWAVFTAAVAFFIVQPQLLKRLPWPALALAFGISLVGLLGLALPGAYRTLLDQLWVQGIYLLFIGPAMAIAYQAILTYTPAHSQVGMRLTTLLGVTLLVGLLGYAGQELIEVEGGVSRFDGRRWEKFSSDNSSLGDGINYQIFETSKGHLWFGGGSGIAIQYANNQWQSYQIFNFLQGLEQQIERARQRGAYVSLVEDKTGYLWGAVGTRFGQFKPDEVEPGNAFQLPRGFPTGADPFEYVTELNPTSISNLDCIEGRVQLWDNKGNFITVLIRHTGSINSVDFNPTGQRILTVSGDGTAQLWDIDGNLIRTLAVRGPELGIHSANFSPNGNHLITVSNTGTVTLWDAGGTFITDLYSGYVDSARFSPNGRFIVGQSRDAVLLWDMDGNIVSVQSGWGIRSASISPDGQRLLLADQFENGQLWDTNGNLITTLQPDSTNSSDEDLNSGIAFVDFSPDGSRIITADKDGRVHLWDAEGNLITNFTARAPFALSPHPQVDGNPPPPPPDILLPPIKYSPDSQRIVVMDPASEFPMLDADGNLITLLRRAEPPHSSHLVEPGPSPPPLYAAGHKNMVAASPDSTQFLTVYNNDTSRRIQLWDKDGNLIASLKGYTGQVNAAAFNPKGTQIVTAECLREIDYVELNFKTAIKDMIFDSDGDLWLATAGDGILRLDTEYPLNDAHWEFFTTENSKLPSDNVQSIHADQQGNMWFGTSRGLMRFDEEVREIVDVLNWAEDVSLVAFLEASNNQLWVGTTQEGLWWNGQAWTSIDDIPGWPDGVGAEVLFEDSQGGIWAGTDIGALRFDGKRWVNLLPKIQVTAFAEDSSGNVWIGSQQGLVQYDLFLQENLGAFNSENSGLVTDWVRDLHVDQNDRVWVSTFATNRTTRSPWLAISLSIIFVGYLFVKSYQSYVKIPETRARRLGRQIIAEPDNLYPTIYPMLAEVEDAPEVLARLAEYLARVGDQTGADTITALASLSSDPDVDAALHQTIQTLRADSDRAWANSLYQLHSLLALVLAARRVPEIADLELVANPGQKTDKVSLRVCKLSVETFPPFLSEGSDEAWHTFEQVCRATHKYREVDVATDRLSYLAKALSATEAAHTATQSLGPPEGIVMVAIANRWREAVTHEINTVSGRAELRLDLRTRQLRRAKQLALVLNLHNDGRAAAENVVITLQPGEGFSPAGEVEIRLERVPSERSIPIELSIMPTDVETVRVVCQLTWDDQLGESNTAEFADVVRFLDVSEEFRRIPNPYIVGHPVKSAEMFHGREDVFRYIEDNLGGAVQDRTLVLHGQRRTGKTSILYQLLHGRLGQNFLPVLIDMQELALLVNSTGDFLGELAYQLARTARKAGVDVEEPALETFETSPTRVFNRFLDTLEDHLGDRRVVVMFDEFELIEHKIVEGKLDANLLGYFRSLIQHRDGLTFIFTGTHRLEEMSHDYWSILFNIALYRRVSFLNSTEATRLIREPVSGVLGIDDLVVEKIMNLTSNQPYFIQLICWALVNHCNVQERNYATINDVNDVIQEILTTGEAHFAYIWQQASPPERLAMAGLAHTLQPGKSWARPPEILETLVAGGDTQTQRPELIEVLDRLVTREVLEVASEGSLRYHFQIEVLRLWVQSTKSVTALVERRE